MKELVPISDQIALLTINGEPININIKVSYAPTCESTNQELELSSDELQKSLKYTAKHITLGDFNAKVSSDSVKAILERYCMEHRNEKETLWSSFVQ